MKSSSTMNAPVEKDVVLKTMTIFDKKDGILFKTTGSDEHITKAGNDFHKKLKGRTDFRVLIEDSKTFDLDFADIVAKAPKVTIERVFIAINLLINGVLLFKLLGHG